MSDPILSVKMNYESAIKALDPCFLKCLRPKKVWKDVYETYSHVTGNFTYFDNISLLRALFLAGDKELFDAYCACGKFHVYADATKKNGPISYCINTDLEYAVARLDPRPIAIAMCIDLHYAAEMVKNAELDTLRGFDFYRKCMLVLLSLLPEGPRLKMLIGLKESELYRLLPGAQIPEPRSGDAKLTPEEIELLKSEVEYLAAIKPLPVNLAAYTIYITDIAKRYLEESLIQKLEEQVYSNPSIIPQTNGIVTVFNLPYSEIVESEDPRLKYVTTLPQYKLDRLQYRYLVNVDKLRDLDFSLHTLDTETCYSIIPTIFEDDFDVMVDKLNDLIVCRVDTREAVSQISGVLKNTDYSVEQLQKLVGLLEMNLLTDDEFVSAMRGIRPEVDDILIKRAEELS